MQKLCNLLDSLTGEVTDLIKRLGGIRDELGRLISFPEELMEILDGLREEYESYLGRMRGAGKEFLERKDVEKLHRSMEEEVHYCRSESVQFSLQWPLCAHQRISANEAHRLMNLEKTLLEELR